MQYGQVAGEPGRGYRAGCHGPFCATRGCNTEKILAGRWLFLLSGQQAGGEKDPSSRRQASCPAESGKGSFSAKVIAGAGEGANSLGERQRGQAEATEHKRPALTLALPEAGWFPESR